MTDVNCKKADYSVKKPIKDIHLGEIDLPDIQRPFVWPRSKVRDLFDRLKRHRKPPPQEEEKIPHVIERLVKRFGEEQIRGMYRLHALPDRWHQMEYPVFFGKTRKGMAQVIRQEFQ